MSSVHSGIRSSAKCKLPTITRWRSESCERFAAFTWLFTKIPIVLQHNSPPPQMTTMTFWSCHPHIHCATSPPITWTRHLISTTNLPPRPLFLLFRPTSTTLHSSLLPLTVPIHFQCPQISSVSMIVLQMHHQPSKTTFLSQFHHSLVIRQPSKVTAFLPLHQMWSSLVQHMKSLTPL